MYKCIGIYLYTHTGIMNHCAVHLKQTQHCKTSVKSEKKKRESVHHSVKSDAVRPYGWQPARLLCPWDSPGKNTGVGCHSLLQRTFSTQGPSPGLPHCRQTLDHLSHEGWNVKHDSDKTGSETQRTDLRLPGQAGAGQTASLG